MKQYIEHTLLKHDATTEKIKTLLDEAIENEFLGVCINPVHVAFARNYLKDSSVKLITVVGFPLGASRSDVKAFETQRAVQDGADEIDMVINIGALKNKNYELVEFDIKAVVEMAADKPVKVIIETDLLEKDEIPVVSKICAKAGAKFVKTSTGFVKNGVGAKVEDIKVMHDTVKSFGLQVKASGCIRSKEDAEKMIEAGAARIGTSSGIAIISGTKSKSNY